MKRQFEFLGTIKSNSDEVEQYRYKNMLICKSEQRRWMETGTDLPDNRKSLLISFSRNGSGRLSERDMMLCAERMGIDTSKPYYETDMRSRFDDKNIHYIEQIVES